MDEQTRDSRAYKAVCQQIRDRRRSLQHHRAELRREPRRRALRDPGVRDAYARLRRQHEMLAYADEAVLGELRIIRLYALGRCDLDGKPVTERGR